MNDLTAPKAPSRILGKFEHPDLTAKGEARASVPLSRLETLWINTGTLCNIACHNCYIESSPENDRLAYITTDEVTRYLDEIATGAWPVTEIGFTGGEPFMNPDILDMLEASLSRGFDVLVLTNAMRPMQRKRIKAGLADLNARHAGKLTLRISLDHHTAAFHDEERGVGAFEISLAGMRWLRDRGIRMTVAGRTMWGESEGDARAGYAALYAANNFKIDAQNPVQTVLFPEMDEQAEVPEITTDCWRILGKRPDEVMCASSRMVVKRKGAERPVVLSCTLLAYDATFEMGETLAEADRPVALNHPHCAKFCVLGGASCSA
ncbi:radical SAM protein [Oceanibium sediminis]|uniref:radical SAM protein n=1 Tax=Oceanibium sediminis TaxID=2026339 RepID=UPI000DD3F536|nr:radical SAM protein [Oceanibium sediminis]